MAQDSGVGKLKRKGRNPKRRIADKGALPEQILQALADRCVYTGSPFHKSDPSDYGLTPPASPRPGKTLCDVAGPVPKATALKLLKKGFTKGMISVQVANEWPLHVWALSEDNEVFEAQLENRDQGSYHGYPLQADDNFRAVVSKNWKDR